MLNRLVPALCFFAGSLGILHAQARYTATRAGDLQVGGDFVVANSDYETSDFKGAGIYATLDLTSHFGAEVDFHDIGSSQGTDEYERTYEIGGRYFRSYGRFSPYVKALYGRGVFNFTQYATGSGYYFTEANLAYNEFVGGAGVDIRIRPYLNARVDYEYQDWHSFPPNGLTPQLLSVGAAYHFGGGLRRGKHY